MKFSDETLAVLKNFAGINPSIMLKPGKVVRTISPQKTVMAEAAIEEEFENDAGIYDLNKFLASVSALDNPEIVFGDDRFYMKQGRGQMFYTYAAESMILTPTSNKVELPSKDVVINLPWDSLQKVVRCAGILHLDEIAFMSDGSTLKLCAINGKNPTDDKYELVIGEGEDVKLPEKPFKKSIKLDNLRLIPNDYTVTISINALAHFKSEKVQYWIALESK